MAICKSVKVKKKKKICPHANTLFRPNSWLGGGGRQLASYVLYVLSEVGTQIEVNKWAVALGPCSPTVYLGGRVGLGGVSQVLCLTNGRSTASTFIIELLLSSLRPHFSTTVLPHLKSCWLLFWRSELQRSNWVLMQWWGAVYCINN